ncbi:MAG: HypC/HybG/HupF family hydrogenase formation chaperone [Candidatus Flexifilum sp.]
MCLAIPGKIIDIYEAGGLQMGKVDFGGVVKEACLAYIEAPSLGDYVMIHVGFAISKVDQDEALRTLELLREMDELDAELGLDEVHRSPADPASNDSERAMQ